MCLRQLLSANVLIISCVQDPAPDAELVAQEQYVIIEQETPEDDAHAIHVEIQQQVRDAALGSRVDAARHVVTAEKRFLTSRNTICKRQQRNCEFVEYFRMVFLQEGEEEEASFLGGEAIELNANSDVVSGKQCKVNTDLPAVIWRFAVLI